MNNIFIFRKETLRNLIILVYVLVIGGSTGTLLIFEWQGLSPDTTYCIRLENEDNEDPLILAAIMASFAFVCILAILIGDILMLIFIWKRKIEVAPSKLVPWKSTSKEEDNDMTVPVHATILSTVLLCFLAGRTALLFQKQTFSWITESFSWAITGSMIPYIIFNVIKTKKPYPVIPRGLQRYEENEEEETGDTNLEAIEIGDTEMNDEERNDKSEIILDPKKYMTNILKKTFFEQRETSNDNGTEMATIVVK